MYEAYRKLCKNGWCLTKVQIVSIINCSKMAHLFNTFSHVLQSLIRAIVHHYLMMPLISYNDLAAHIKVNPLPSYSSCTQITHLQMFIQSNAETLHLDLYKTDLTVRMSIHETVNDVAMQMKSNFQEGVGKLVLSRLPHWHIFIYI